MAATYVTYLELQANLGIGTLYANSIVEEVCQTAEDLLNEFLWFNSFPIVGVNLASNYAYVVVSASNSFAVNQSVTISGCGATYNGVQTVTSTWPWTQGSGTFPVFNFMPYNLQTFPRGYCILQFSKIAADDNYHQILPYGKVVGSDTKTTAYASTPAVREAAMMLATDIWQARQQSSAGGISPDFAPSPYRMGNTLMARVRGLISPYTNPRSMVG